MRERAHKLDDGRRVFKANDGNHIFDEHGAQVPPEILPPSSVADHRPRWETFKAAMDEKQALQQERKQIMEFQKKLDAAREARWRG